MELGFLALVVASAAIGLLCRARLSSSVERFFLVAGLSALSLGLALLVLTVIGWGPLDTWTAGLVSVILFFVAVVALPFAIAVRVGRRS